MIVDEELHKYYININEKLLIELCSVTFFINNKLFEPFNEDLISKTIELREKDVNNKYYNLTAEEIKYQWKLSRDAGINFHKYIENYYNKIDIPIEIKNTNEFIYFKNFEYNEIIKNGLIPFKSEWRVYDI